MSQLEQILEVHKNIDEELLANCSIYVSNVFLSNHNDTENEISSETRNELLQLLLSKKSNLVASFFQLSEKELNSSNETKSSSAFFFTSQEIQSIRRRQQFLLQENWHLVEPLSNSVAEPVFREPFATALKFPDFQLLHKFFSDKTSNSDSFFKSLENVKVESDFSAGLICRFIGRISKGVNEMERSGHTVDLAKKFFPYVERCSHFVFSDRSVIYFGACLTAIAYGKNNSSTMISDLAARGAFLRVAPRVSSAAACKRMSQFLVNMIVNCRATLLTTASGNQIIQDGFGTVSVLEILCDLSFFATDRESIQSWSTAMEQLATNKVILERMKCPAVKTSVNKVLEESKQIQFNNFYLRPLAGGL